MKRARGTQRAGERGQALVEFALILPILLMLVVGILEFARAWNVHQALTDATREAARRAVVANDVMRNVDSVKAAVWRSLQQAGYDPAYDTVTISPAGWPDCANCKDSGINVTVDVKLPYRFWLLPTKPIVMRSIFTMRNE